MVIYVLRLAMEAIVEILKTPINIDGFVISLWAVFLFSILAGLLLLLLFGLFK